MRIICSLMAVLLMFGSLVSCQKPKYKDADKVELGNNTVKDAITTVKDVSEIKPVQGSTVDEEAAQIILNGSETAVGFDGAAFADNTLTITKAGTYLLTGTLEEGALVVDTQDSETVKLIFNGVSISNSKISPITVINAPKRVTIHVQKNSVNKIVDTAQNKNGQYGEDAAIYSKEDLRFTGAGTLVVESKYDKGIVSKDDLEIKNGNITVKSAGDCINGKDSVTVVGGVLNLTSTDADGIESGNNETLGKGIVTIDAGDIYISAGDDGIHAEQQLHINGGNINVIKSVEGIEGIQIYINGGNTVINASDDGVNANGGNSMMGPGGPGGGGPGGGGGGRPGKPRSMGESDTQTSSTTDVTKDIESKLAVSGGYLEVSTPSGDTDGIDSNGTIEISGGTVFVKSKSAQGNMAGSIDCEMGLTVTGGNVIALGGICETPEGASTNYTVTFNRTTLSVGKYLVTDAEGTELLSFELDSSYSGGWISLEAFVKSGKYEITCDGTRVASLTAS